MFFGDGDGLDRPALGDEGEQLLVRGGQVVVARLHRSHQGVDDHRVEQGAAGGDGADGVGELVALGEAVLQQVRVAGRAVGEERHGVLGVVVLAQDHDAGARLALPDLLGRVDALALEGRRHADVADDHLGLVLGGRRQQLGMVGGFADDLDVGLAATGALGRPERTRRLSSASTTVITPSGMASIQSHLTDRGEGAAMHPGGGAAPPLRCLAVPLGRSRGERMMGSVRDEGAER